MPGRRAKNVQLNLEVQKQHDLSATFAPYTSARSQEAMPGERGRGCPYANRDGTPTTTGMKGASAVVCCS